MLRFSPNPNLAHLVRWFEWEEEAFRLAREQGKPVMLFLGAFWCRYCQRMDEEAFSERENMALLNAYFVALRVENATRPDVDARYNLNGWPTIAFFTPTGELFAACNYLPGEEFKELLLNVYLGYQQKGGVSGAQKKTQEEAATTAAEGEQKLSYEAALSDISAMIMALADRENGGYGSGQKFIQADANAFLLARYEATNEVSYLDQVCLTLDRMGTGEIHDTVGGGFFRTTTGADWSQPHREKLLGEQAGLLSNYLAAFRLTRRAEYARVAEEIVGYLDHKLFDPARGAFFGCEDFPRREPAVVSSAEEFFTIIDECIYTDANALVIIAYLEAAALLNRPDCQQRALIALESLWRCCRDAEQGMYHYHDNAAHLPGLLSDQAQMGMALLRAYSAAGGAQYLERARELAEFIVARLKNPSGAYFDLADREIGFLKLRLTDISQNGAAASFFLEFAEATKESTYRDAALWALRAFAGNCCSYGIHAAPFGKALSDFVSRC
jgi:uncharacterized protein YyaL (SSP411 family)